MLERRCRRSARGIPFGWNGGWSSFRRSFCQYRLALLSRKINGGGKSRMSHVRLLLAVACAATSQSSPATLRHHNMMG